MSALKLHAGVFCKAVHLQDCRTECVLEQCVILLSGVSAGLLICSLGSHALGTYVPSFA
jgi:hypothetical protein